MAGESSVLKLIVKAPNQLIEDQSIDCNINWSVHQLKSHLSQVYPSKPAPGDQKLIYSGQLLVDEALLKDVLRNYEGQKAHSLHLVCIPPRGTPDTWRKSSCPQTSSPARVQSTPPSSQIPEVSAEPNNLTPAEIAQDAPHIPATTGEQAFTSTDSWSSWLQSTQQRFMAASTQYSTMSAYPSLLHQAYDPVSMAQMQQVYSQYITQYLCQLQQAGVSAETLSSMQVQAQQSWNLQYNQQQVPRVIPVPGNQGPVQAPINQQQPAPQQIGADDDDIRLGRQRDWLDWFYVLSRLLVLFSIVYFYSSLQRFVLVSILGILLYLYHLGYFRVQAPVADADNNNQPPAEVPPAEPHDVVQQIPNEVAQEVEGVRQRRTVAANQEGETNQTDTTPVAPEPIVVVPPASMFNMTWTFVSSFFSSLIPDRPNVI